MGREWDEVNDVAVISWQAKSGRHGGSGVALRCSESYNETHWRTQTFGRIEDEIVTSVRPLVVIDPEDREAARRLLETYGRQFTDWTPELDHNVTRFQAALREFASPQPVKPEEPLGLGAVVEDVDGDQFVRAGDGWLPATVAGVYRNPIEWDRIAAVKVLSEGVRDE